MKPKLNSLSSSIIERQKHHHSFILSVWRQEINQHSQVEGNGMAEQPQENTAGSQWRANFLLRQEVFSFWGNQAVICTAVSWNSGLILRNGVGKKGFYSKRKIVTLILLNSVICLMNNIITFNGYNSLLWNLNFAVVIIRKGTIYTVAFNGQ